jgi:hypothetical protein
VGQIIALPFNLLAASAGANEAAGEPLPLGPRNVVTGPSPDKAIRP